MSDFIQNQGVVAQSSSQC